MLNGLDLFTGIGGLTLGLSPWVRPVAYCENNRYAQAVLLSRMAERLLPTAPIWDDVRTFPAEHFEGQVDIISGGFPCQNISIAGDGSGLEGEQSGLFFEILRLTDALRPPYLFLENVPAITVRGMECVLGELSTRGYDCRWKMLSASEIGANHRRNRWWCLAYSDEARLERWEQEELPERAEQQTPRKRSSSAPYDRVLSGWWEVEPKVGRVANGIPWRVHRIECLGNAVVPSQAEQAFKELMGI